MWRALACVLLLAAACQGKGDNAKLRKRCTACKDMARKFYDGVETTAKSIHFSGGNPDGWTKDKEKVPCPKTKTKQQQQQHYQH